MKEDMIIMVRTFDLLAWLLPKAEQFPRVYRFTVVKRMTDAALNLQESLHLAQSKRGRARYQQLQECDVQLQHLRLYLRLAHHWHWLNDGQYHFVSQMVAEIGRLLGGWLKQTQ